MIGLVVVAHGALAQSLLAATEHVVGPLENAHAVSIEAQDDLHARQAQINDLVAKANTGQGVVLVTDMFGGTPSNLALGAIAGSDVEVICGANLPLLVKLAKMRRRPLAEAVRAALEAGHKYIDSASNILDPVASQERR
ncbi:MAG: PTS sugar transporter subunit IIA [Paracoccaceae bacterium]|nr:PTS sugar transporter subunit IIA [Paracoccaceae bacterium]